MNVANTVCNTLRRFYNLPMNTLMSSLLALAAVCATLGLMSGSAPQLSAIVGISAFALILGSMVAARLSNHSTSENFTAVGCAFLTGVLMLASNLYGVALATPIVVADNAVFTLPDTARYAIGVVGALFMIGGLSRVEFIHSKAH